MAKSSKSLLNSAKKQYKSAMRQERKRYGLPVNKKTAYYDKYKLPASTYKPKKATTVKPSSYAKSQSTNNQKEQTSNNGCYIATCVYGSYDCPEVWTLRRYRDYVLDKTWYGRLFIKMYYKISPKVVKLFGDRKWFRKLWKNRLDAWVFKLNNLGVQNSKYYDRY